MHPPGGGAVTGQGQDDDAWVDGLQPLRQLAEVLPLATYVCDPDGRITYFNRAAVELWGRVPRVDDPADRFCGSVRLYQEDGRQVRHDECGMAIALRSGRPILGEEVVVERPDGTRRTGLAHVTPLLREDGRLLGAINIFVDIT
jgi:PAS domain-containing protein